MTEQMPVISTPRNVATTDKKSSSLIGRGLIAIMNKETDLTLSEQDARYRQARDIYNRITDYGNEKRFNAALLPKRGEQFDPLEANQLQPFFTLLQQLSDVSTVFQQLADKGYGKAYFPLAYMYQFGQGLSQSIPKTNYYSLLASKWCHANQSLNDPEIWADLGWMYQCAQYVEEAVFWYRKAAEQGLPFAQCSLGWMYQYGNGVEQDNKQAVFWYRKAAEQSIAFAQYHLGWRYQRCHGVEQNDKQAVFWYRKAAEQGHFFSQYHLGWMYQHGQGVEQDDKQAVFWYRKTAEQGHSFAQFNLGWMYEYGHGLEQDDKQAVFWYSKAAEQNHAKAQEELTNRGINWKNT
ncbi:MAG: tetratricopeptide repeat protein [Methylococcaceae bacterium]